MIPFPWYQGNHPLNAKMAGYHSGNWDALGDGVNLIFFGGESRLFWICKRLPPRRNFWAALLLIFGHDPHLPFNTGGEV